jgi:hypothetical protein
MKLFIMNKKNIVILMAFITQVAFAQQIPSPDENFPYMVTFGNKAEKSWGDDDFCQILFFVVPKSQTGSIYLRVFDADCGGEIDENRGGFNSKTKFSIHGAGCFSEKDEENKGPNGNFKQGNILFSKVIGQDAAYDNKWYSFGPINPVEGDLKPGLGGYIFKVIIQGIEGDDGNLYKFFMSTKEDNNVKVEGGNVFTYEYSVRLNTTKSVSHLYAYVDVNTVAVKQHNFDLDNDAYIKIISMSNPGTKMVSSGDGEWKESSFPISEKDKNSSLDIQIIKTGESRNNNIVFSVTNQYGKFLPFYAIPLGSVPKKSIKVVPKK